MSAGGVPGGADVAGGSLRPARALVAAVAAGLALLALAPPDSNLAWAFDGLRSVRLPVAFKLVAAAIAVPFLVVRTRVPGAALVLALAALLAFPLREGLHLIGDAELRVRVLEGMAAAGAAGGDLGAAARALHAQPLDLAVDVALPLWLVRAGLPVPSAVALIGALLLLVYAAGIRHAVSACAPAPTRRALVAALLLAGTLQAFAGYAEVWALALAAAVWWWVALTRPLARPRDAALAAVAWLVLFLAHRLALPLLIAQAWRACGPRFEGDRPAVRRLHAGLTLAVAAVAVTLGARSGDGTLGRDLSDLGRSLLDPGALRLTPPWDLAGLALLTLPLAVLAPLMAGRDACAAYLRTPRAALALVALVPLVPMVLVFPVAPHGMGAMRDWDLAALPGLIASLGAAGAIGSAPPARARAALVTALPLLALLAGGWVAVNADVAAGERRALMLVEAPFAPPAEPRNQALVFLGYRAAGARDFARSARMFERASGVLPNPRHLLFASQAWVMAGDLAAARRCLADAHALGPLPPDVARTAATVEALVREAAAGAPR